MAALNFTIPDTKIELLKSAFAEMYGYQTEIDDGNGTLIPNPQTVVEFSKEQILNHMKKIVREYERRTAAAGVTYTDVTED